MPSKQTKYKVQTVANDLGIDKAELLKILDEVFPVKTPRKAASAIGADEVGYLLEKFTRANEVKDLFGTFAQTKSIKTPKPAVEEKRETKKKN